MLRALGGSLYFTGAVLMAINLYKTAKSGVFQPETEAQAAPLVRVRSAETAHPYRHRWLEAKPLLFTGLSVAAILVGGMVEIIPMWLVKQNVPTIASVKPYTPLEVLGAISISAKVVPAAIRR
jgi:cytochrome c oxidase cbb3-type subunit I/II